MNKKISVYLADLFPAWAYIFAFSVPVLLSMSLLDIRYNWAYMAGGAAIAVFLLIYTTARTIQLFEKQIMTERRRYDDDQRAQGYHFHHGFEEAVENIEEAFNLRLNEHRLESRREINDISRKVQTERESITKSTRRMFASSVDNFRRQSTQHLEETNSQLRQRLDTYINQTIKELDTRLQAVYAVSKKQEEYGVGIKDLREHEDHIRRENHRALNLMASSITGKMESRSERITREILEKTEHRLIAECEQLRNTTAEKLDTGDKRMRNELLQVIEQMNRVQDKKLENIRHDYARKLAESMRRLKENIATVSAGSRNLEDKEIEALREFTKEQTRVIKKELSASIIEAGKVQNTKIEDLRKEAEKRIHESNRHMQDNLASGMSRLRTYKHGNSDNGYDSLKEYARQQAQTLRRELSSKVKETEALQESKIDALCKEAERQLHESNRRIYENLSTNLARTRENYENQIKDLRQEMARKLKPLQSSD